MTGAQKPREEDTAVSILKEKRTTSKTEYANITRVEGTRRRQQSGRKSPAVTPHRQFNDHGRVLKLRRLYYALFIKGRKTEEEKACIGL